MRIDLNKLAKQLLHKYLVILFIVFVVTVISGFGLTNFKLDASSDALVLENDESLKAYREAEDEFGDSSFLIITYEPNQELFSDYSINRIANLENDLKNIDGVDSVLSLLDAPIFFQPKVGLTQVADNLKDLTFEDINLEQAKDEIINNPIYKELIISNDGSVTAMQVVLRGNDEYDLLIKERYELLDILSSKEPLSNDVKVNLQKRLIEINKRVSMLNNQESDFNKQLISNIRNVISKYKDEATIYLGGPSMIATDMMQYIESDLVIFGSAVALIFALMLFIFFGSLWFVLLPLMNAFLATFITAGFLGYMDWKISVVSSNFIALLLILTISLTVHLLVKINELNKQTNFKDAIIQGYDQMFAPCFFAALTTAVAFLSLTFGDLKPVIEFGKMMAFGISIAFMLTFTFLPCALYFINQSNTKDYLSLHKVTQTLLNFSQNNRQFITFSFLTLFSILCFGISKLEVENRFIDYFDEETEIYKGMYEIDSKLGGTATLDIIISQPDDSFESIEIQDEFFEDDLFEDETSEAAGYWWNIYSLNELEKIHDYLDSIPEIGKVLSVASGVKLARQINDGEDLNDLELALLRSVLPEDIRESLLYSYINKDDSVVRISTRVNESASNLNRNDLLNMIDNKLQTEFNLDPSQYEMTGLAVLYNNMLQSLFKSQIGSLLIVFAVISLMLFLIFKSIKIMIIGLIPNIFVASSVMGLLGLLNIPLDIMTITVAAISVGMAVDNTIHYIYRYKKELKVTNSAQNALKNAHATTGRAIFYTASTIAAGFCILSLSNFFPTILFGLFTSIAMILAFVSSLTLLPNLLVKYKVFQ
ncbi:MAG: transporter [SAR86 cluster bacterium]|uniref:Transporter n=1 Tax=SAR86 cluster bacterium TaxID=2030880 RepID=A0A520N5Z1_9GAMM|nr:MAG: transporter [SAR86 cluster bacterium]